VRSDLPFCFQLSGCGSFNLQEGGGLLVSNSSWKSNEGNHFKILILLVITLPATKSRVLTCTWMDELNQGATKRRLSRWELNHAGSVILHSLFQHKTQSWPKVEQAAPVRQDLMLGAGSQEATKGAARRALGVSRPSGQEMARGEAGAKRNAGGREETTTTTMMMTTANEVAFVMYQKWAWSCFS